eukprot:Hpha_TRINITY_DN30722_c0_g1::TRINITY_DN30722_c0_g1_i1::g.28428::m.28428
MEAEERRWEVAGLKAKLIWDEYLESKRGGDRSEWGGTVVKALEALSRHRGLRPMALADMVLLACCKPVWDRSSSPAMVHTGFFRGRKWFVGPEIGDRTLGPDVWWAPLEFRSHEEVRERVAAAEELVKAAEERQFCDPRKEGNREWAKRSREAGSFFISSALTVLRVWQAGVDGIGPLCSHLRDMRMAPEGVRHGLHPVARVAAAELLCESVEKGGEGAAEARRELVGLCHGGE